MPSAVNLKAITALLLPFGRIEVVPGSVQHIETAAPSIWSLILTQRPTLCVRYRRADTGEEAIVQSGAVLGFEPAALTAAVSAHQQVANALAEAQQAPPMPEYASLEISPGTQPGTRRLFVRIPAGRRLSPDAVRDIGALLDDKVPGPTACRPDHIEFVIGGNTTADIRLADILQRHPLQHADLIGV